MGFGDATMAWVVGGDEVVSDKNEREREMENKEMAEGE